MISFVWQLPQNLIGLLVLLFNLKKYEKITRDGITFYYVKHVNNCGVSLGNFIFLDSDKSISAFALKHEYGHQLQSKKLGPLYLLIIGIPSAVSNLIYRLIKNKLSNPQKWYYSLPWEAWANKLGNTPKIF